MKDRGLINSYSAQHVNHRLAEWGLTNPAGLNLDASITYRMTTPADRAAAGFSLRIQREGPPAVLSFPGPSPSPKDN